MINILFKLKINKIIRPIDYHIAKLLFDQCPDDILALITCIISYEVNNGNTFLPLTNISNSHLFINNIDNVLLMEILHKQNFYFLDNPKQLINHLLQLHAVGTNESSCPLIIENENIYFNRYLKYEKNIALHFNDNYNFTMDVNILSNILSELFARPYHLIFNNKNNYSTPNTTKQSLIHWLDIIKENKINWSQAHKCVMTSQSIKDLNQLDALIPENYCVNWQKVAVTIAILFRISIIAGGPGTGKTTTVARLIMALLLLYHTNEKPFIIQLAAPTGKAAGRLTESLKTQLVQQKHYDLFKDYIPLQATTIHRLLGTKQNESGYIQNKTNKLYLDVLIVDEASMIDLPIMNALLDAVPEHARIVFLGDPYQLTSVEVGRVLGDICHYSNNCYSDTIKNFLVNATEFDIQPNTNDHYPLIKDAICTLQKSYRFDNKSGINLIANTIKNNTPEKLPSIFQSNKSNINIHGTNLLELVKLCCSNYSLYLKKLRSKSYKPSDILNLFNTFRLLCATNEGEFGIIQMNNAIHKHLIQKGLIEDQKTWYVGRPVLITHNDYSLELFNGDIGITMESKDKQLRVFFEHTDGTIKQYLPNRLPEHETVFALTIHKSQGSEFNHVAILLPDQPHPMLTRELLYTAVTRAKSYLDLFCSEHIIKHCIMNPTMRTSGLRQRLVIDNTE